METCDRNGNCINDAPTYAQEQLADIERREDEGSAVMTIDEAIEHCENVAKTMLEIGIDKKCIQCGKEHLQLAMWLKELKEYKK